MIGMSLRVLITGCNGLLGTAMVQQFNSVGFTTIGVTKDAETPSLCSQTLFGSATDADLISEAMVDIDCVIHLAAIRTPRNDPPREVFEKNSVSSFNVLTMAAERDVKTIIHASSISALGFSFSQTPLAPIYFPINDEHPYRVSDAYGLSKVVDEQTVRYIKRRYQSNIYAIRFPYVGDAAVLLPERAEKIANDSNFGSNEFWSYLEINDAVALTETLIMERPELTDPIFTVVAPNTLAKVPTEELIQRHFPELKDRPTFKDFDGVFAPSKILEKTSFRYRHIYANS
jgi:nucleoside-diphosphate-sugar epimerase